MRHEIRDTVEFPGFSKFPEFLEGFLANEDIKSFGCRRGANPMIRAGIAAQIQYDLLDIDVEELAKADCNSCVIVRKFFAPTRPKFFNAIDPNSPFEWNRFDVLTSG